MDYAFPLIAGLKLYEIVCAISLACVGIMLLNIKRYDHPVKALFSFVTLSYFLWGGLARFEDLGEAGNLFWSWGIGGAIAAFTLRGTILLGCAGGVVGLLTMAILGAVLCPLYWIYYVFVIVTNALRVAPAYNIVVTLISFLSVTTLVWKQEVVVHEHRQYGDGKTCCGVYVRGQKYVDGDWLDASGARQALVTGETYTPASLEASCGSFVAADARDERLFRLCSGSTADSVNIETYTGTKLRTKAPEKLVAGSIININPRTNLLLDNGRVNMETVNSFDKESVLRQTRRLKVEALLYAYPDGFVRGHTNILRKLMH